MLHLESILVQEQTMELKQKKRCIKLYNVDIFISSDENQEELVQQLQHQLAEFRRNLYFCISEEKGSKNLLDNNRNHKRAREDR